MAAAFNSFNSYNQASFFFAKLNEFIHHWKSGRKASIKFECKEGLATHHTTCNLGYPDLPFIQDGAQRRRNKPRVKSDIRRARDNARAAAYQRARASSSFPPAATPAPARPVISHAAPPPFPPSTTRTVTSPAPSSPTSMARPATSPAVLLPDSPMEDIWEPSELNDTRAARYAFVPLSPGIHREAEPHDVSCLPSSPLPSFREEPRRQEANMSAQIPVDSLERPNEDDSDSSNSCSETVLYPSRSLHTSDWWRCYDPPSSPSSSPEREPGGQENYDTRSSGTRDLPDSLSFQAVKSKRNQRKSQKKKRKLL